MNIVSCQDKTENSLNWKAIDFSKIPGETFRDGFFEPITKYQFNQILPINEQHFVLLGDNSGDRDENYMPKEVEAIAFVSSDGGENLKKHNLGKGSLSIAFHIGETIFLAKNISKNRKYSSQLIKSDTLLDHWEIISEWTTEEINNIRFFSEDVGIVSFGYVDAQGYKTIQRYTVDGGENWIEIKNASKENSFFIFISSTEIEFIENNKLIKLNFITGERKILKEDIVAKASQYNGPFFENPIKKEPYCIIYDKEDSANTLIKYLHTDMIIQIPTKESYPLGVGVYGDFLQTMVKDGVYYNYMWSEDNGKTWHTEKIRDFFVVPRPIAYYKKGMVYCEIILFKGKQEEKGGRFAIGKMKQ